MDCLPPLFSTRWRKDTVKSLGLGSFQVMGSMASEEPVCIHALVGPTTVWGAPEVDVCPVLVVWICASGTGKAQIFSPGCHSWKDHLSQSTVSYGTGSPLFQCPEHHSSQDTGCVP